MPGFIDFPLEKLQEIRRIRQATGIGTTPFLESQIAMKERGEIFIPFMEGGSKAFNRFLANDPRGVAIQARHAARMKQAMAAEGSRITPKGVFVKESLMSEPSFEESMGAMGEAVTGVRGGDFGMRRKLGMPLSPQEQTLRSVFAQQTPGSAFLQGGPPRTDLGPPQGAAFGTPMQTLFGPAGGGMGPFGRRRRGFTPNLKQPAPLQLVGLS